MAQMGIPVEVTAVEVSRQANFGESLDLCRKVAGLTPKEINEELKQDKAFFSRWVNDGEGITWAKLSALMDFCGNDAPLFWMLQARGYDLHSLRKLETETEKQLRIAKEENEALRAANRVLVDAMNGRVAA